MTRIPNPQLNKRMCSRYKISDPDVTFESFEGESLLINLANGNYHSLRESAVPVWPLLLAGQTSSKIAQLWPDQTNADQEIITFAQQLVEAGLINSRGEAPVEDRRTPQIHRLPLTRALNSKDTGEIAAGLQRLKTLFAEFSSPALQELFYLGSPSGRNDQDHSHKAAMNSTDQVIKPAKGRVAKYHAAKYAVFHRLHDDFIAYREIMRSA